jgi:hypothetical protein
MTVIIYEKKLNDGNLFLAVRKGKYLRCQPLKCQTFIMKLA